MALPRGGTPLPLCQFNSALPDLAGGAFQPVRPFTGEPLVRLEFRIDLGGEPGCFVLVGVGPGGEPAGDDGTLGSYAARVLRDFAVLAVLGRVRYAPAVRFQEVDPQDVYLAALRLRLDPSQLPKPLQIDALGSSDWNLSSDWYRWTLKQITPLLARPARRWCATSTN